MTDNERIDYVIGQVVVLKAFAISAGVVSPRPSELLQAFERSAEHTVAKLLPTSASESMLNGIESMRTEIAAC